MAQEFGTPIDPIPPINPIPPKKSNTGLIIGIVVAVLLLCCCCLGGVGYWLWNNGDALLEGVDMSLLFSAMLV